MSHEADSSAACVLHIRSGESRHVASISALLDESGTGVETCGDVYAALARLCAPPRTVSIEPSSIRAVVVDISVLGTAEMEFFSLLARSKPGLPVYVYGPDHLEARITEALNRGAAGVATEKTVRSLAASASSVLEEAEQSSETVHVADALEPAPVENTTTEPVFTEDLEDEPDERNDEIEMPPRLPWLRNADAPSRIGPRRPSNERADTPDTGEVADKQRPSTRYEPLLSEEELRVLLGDDDIAAIAPDNAGSDNLGKGQP